MRVVIAEDDVLLRAGLASLLTSRGIDVVAVTNGAEQTVTTAVQLRPDVVVADIRMPPTQTAEGFLAAREIRQVLPDVGILLLSAHVQVDAALELIESGRGMGYLLKQRVTDAEEFIDAVHRVAAGGSVIDPALIIELIDARRQVDPLAALSLRERDVLLHMAQGRSNLGIGRVLWITEATVEKHVRSILTKLDLDVSEDNHRRVLAVLRYLDSI